MGIYINPPSTTKEEFLKQYCTQITRQKAEDWAFTDPSKILLCHVYNPQFSALGIMYDPRERDVFTGHDPRPMRYFVTSRKAITQEKSGVSEEELARYERF